MIITMQTQLKGVELKQEISTKQSQALVKDLVSISLNCITFLRNIFGDDNYVDRKFICTENPNIKSGFVKTKHLVEGISKEADMFKNWIDCGVHNAISLQYLSALQFGIYIDENQPEKLSETYIFKFDYNNGNISFGINDEDKCEPLSELTAREKVQQLIKRLIVLTQTFGPLPEKKHISVRLLFNEKCPRDYQPSFFKDASDLESPTITVDVGNSSDNIGTLDTGHDKVNIKILTNVGIQITNPLNLDPFDIIEDNDNHDPHKFENQIEFPKANNSLSLNKYLFSNKPDDIHSTQLVPPSQSYYSGNFRLTCECNCWTSASRIKLSMKGFAILTCRTCQRQVHSCCYGMNHSKPIKKSVHTFKCYSCMLDTDSLDEDLILLMRLRYLWKYMSCYDIPESLDLFYEIFSLTTMAEDDVVRKMLNKLFHDKILMVLDEPVIVRGNKNAMGTGYLTPTIDLLLDNKGNSLVKNHIYNIAFTPTLKSPKSMCHTDKQVFYFPDTYNTKSNILSLLKEFKTSLLKNQEFDDDPIESSSPIFNTKTMENRGEIMKPVDQTRTSHANESLVDEDMDELSFEDSLNFLSQPANNQDSEGVNFLQDKVNHVHVSTSKRKLDSSSIINYKVKNRKISVNDDTCF
ncbi:DEHA2D14740p [Debaryomyces hansenii CBS767]|uniref:DEHA2D14740p n=1 Tax=Debaryomyces hansenii (strain ATCC 36239 / CBS 767 / BCRC 21394 / JCM 1990 / NBRC 0083 / IGC 2968) TaxID=284592 RepID=Q6BRP9_DEBHA|nr:DEHA2D14740p [Debaryomyces hansenii CBS767]CAG87290.2 DEHA2D14740p [Debaryomyces hansenii CBS767]|eukprot:XP_459121.2 DEHA2D14740p [Debaryomyces hansenii CBS767]